MAKMPPRKGCEGATDVVRQPREGLLLLWSHFGACEYAIAVEIKGRKLRLEVVVVGECSANDHEDHHH